MFASFDPGTGRVAQFVVNCLAILGGFLTGYVLTALLANLLDRAVFLRKTPRVVHRWLRFLGGLMLALLIAGIVFGHGQGWNLFGGGGSGNSSSNETGSPQLFSTPINNPDVPNVVPTEKAMGEQIHITILGGTDVKNEKFYLIDTDTTPRTFAEAKEMLLKRKTDMAKPLMLIIELSKRNELPSDHPAVKILEYWAQKEAGFGVSHPPVDGR
jgi:hypothetical protein